MNRPVNKRLGDIANFKRGYDLPSYIRKDGQYPIISSSGISGYHSEYKKDGEGLVTGRYGTLGTVYYVNGKYWPHNTALYVTDFKGNHPKYVYYLMKCLGSLKTSDKSTVPGINRNDLHEILVPYINNSIFQRQIASVLSSLDAKIELNNRINAQLEAMAKTIYDYWFVQFDFPSSPPMEGCLQDGVGKGKPYKSSGGKMVYNEQLKREIPEGWEVKQVGSVLSKESNVLKIQSSEYEKEGLTPIIDQSTDYIAGFTNNRKTIIEGSKIPRIIFGDHTRILKLVNFDFARGADGTQVLLSSKENLPQHLFYHSLLKIDLSNYGYARHFKFLKEKQIILPNIDIAKKFEKIVSSFYNMRKSNIHQNQQLTQLRDWLLPMLMNGQVTVKKAYAMVDEQLSMAAEE